MSFRRSAALALAAAALVSGCKKVTQEDPKGEFTVAAFGVPSVPAPNDIALAQVPTLPASAQRALLQAFVDAGGFPSDQAVSLTVPIVRYVYDPGQVRYVPHAVQLDPATLTSAAGGAATFALFKVDGGTVTRVDTWELDPTSSVTASDGGSWTLAIRSKPVGTPGAQNRRWPTGRYVFALRGGANGVKTIDGKPIGPDAAVDSALRNVPLDNPQNVPIGTPPEKLALLETVRKALWLPLDWGRSAGGDLGSDRRLEREHEPLRRGGRRLPRFRARLLRDVRDRALDPDRPGGLRVRDRAAAARPPPHRAGRVVGCEDHRVQPGLRLRRHRARHPRRLLYDRLDLRAGDGA